MTQYRNAAIHNWVDHNARHRIINQVIYEELYGGSDWEERVAERLLHFGIELSAPTMRRYVGQIVRSERDPVCASAFSEKSPGGLAARSGKETMYGQIDLLERTFLQGIGLSYVGLPANQILSVIRKYGDSVRACERDRRMVRFMRFLKDRFFPESGAHVIDGDIFWYLDETEERYTVFDIDLMMYVKGSTVDQIASAVNRTAGQRAVISVASCIGRKITEAEYRTLMPSRLIEKLKLRVLANYSGGYCDHVAPMRYELLAVER